MTPSAGLVATGRTGRLHVQMVAPGDPGHGVVRHARRLRDALPAVGGDRDGAADVVHAHFTDALWGPDVDAAAEAFLTWARRRPCPLVVTLHDVPGIDGDAERDARRIRAYRRVVAAAPTVVVSDTREARDVAAWSGRRAVVVPLPVPDLAAPGPAPFWAGRPSVGVLGHVYPGKGHADVVRACVGTGALVVALGDGPARRSPPCAPSPPTAASTSSSPARSPKRRCTPPPGRSAYPSRPTGRSGRRPRSPPGGPRDAARSARRRRTCARCCPPSRGRSR